MIRMMLVAVLALVTLAGGAQMPAPTPSTPDYASVKRQLAVFETVLNTSVRQRFQLPFGILQEAKGAYLEGFGVVFTMEMNLYPLRSISLFDRRPYTEKEIQEGRERKKQRIREAEELVLDLLRDHGASLNSLRPEESVVVVLHMFNNAELRDMPSQLVVRAPRQTILDAAGQRLTTQEFAKRMTVVTF